MSIFTEYISVEVYSQTPKNKLEKYLISGGSSKFSTVCVYSLTSINLTIGHKNFRFCEQTLHKGLIDASCNWLQSTR
jgi:hypothetical protein